MNENRTIPLKDGIDGPTIGRVENVEQRADGVYADLVYDDGRKAEAQKIMRGVPADFAPFRACINYGEPFVVIGADIDNPLEIYATVGPEKIRVPVGHIYRNIRKERRGDLASHDDLARRIVACVNACEGMTTEALEKIASDPATALYWKFNFEMATNSASPFKQVGVGLPE